jgi:NAD(P)-dependent dehydrogenase (short-subunit alcohol dehydrogenase family)
MATVANVKGKVIALTGAASGIGLATARVLASRGAHLSLADVQEKQLLSAAEEIRSQNPDVKVTTTVLDVRSEDQVNSWITKTVQELGSLDGAANVAGTAGKPGAMGQIKDFQTENWEFIMGINCTGVFYCMRAQLQNMKEGAAIVNVASVAGLASARGLCAYGASKAAVINLTKTAARENGERNIRVNAIAP